MKRVLIMPRAALLVLLAAFLVPCAALCAPFDVNDVKLGDSELAAKKGFPGIRCKPLEWKSDAADRRCDDAKVSFAGVESRVTFYLKGGAIQGFDLRFESAHVERVADFVKRRYGTPTSESREKIVRKNKEAREAYKILWEQGNDKALLSSLSTGKRASLSVSRGGFEDEIYRVQ
ncbi:MAG: hypothetical protein EXR29_06325 [Betaproteobacteria bacterium]|nr:hypothetical protein [Betaproteobacteria bacterium]